jgi:hypothetical protein
MPKRKSLRRILSEAGPLIAVAVGVALLLGVMGPASAQFFDFGFGRQRPQYQQPQQQQRGFGGFFSPFQQVFPGAQPQQQQQQQRAVDYSKAPPPEKRETVPERNVLVIGDAMADWLAYGLEDAFVEQPDMGVIRRNKITSGLIKYQPKGEPSDWAAAAKGILAVDKPDAIVVMLGLNDRGPIRETVEKTAPKTPADKKTDKKDPRKADDKSGAKTNDAASAASSDDKPSDLDPNSDDQADGDIPSIAAPEKAARSASGTYDFRDDRWVELYSKKIEELITVLKSKGVPVVWVGLPAVRGPKATSDMLFLDALYRDVAGKTGITYVDVWDGFVDEAGRFMLQGPDFEGQTRKLRTADGVFFTRAGARKLAHYAEREVTRLLASRTTPIALPIEPATPDTSARPGGPTPRPLTGPIVPLVASSVGTDDLLGGPGTRPAAVDALAGRTLVKGEALAAPAGRADDSSWPRREVGRLEPGKDVPVAASTQTPKTDSSVASASPDAIPGQTGQKKKRAPLTISPPGAFGFDARPAVQPPQQQRSRDGSPRPPGNVGRAASTPGGFFSFLR